MRTHRAYGRVEGHVLFGLAELARPAWRAGTPVGRRLLVQLQALVRRCTPNVPDESCGTLE